MWVTDYQIFLKDGADAREGEPLTKSILLKKGKKYTIGRALSCDIKIDHPKVSRSQSEIMARDDDKLELLNTGSGVWSYGHNLLHGQQDHPLILNTTATFKLRSANNWKIKFYKVEELIVSTYVHKQLRFLDLECENSMNDNEVIIRGNKEIIFDMEDWLRSVKAKQWETSGGLAKLIIPKTLETEQLRDLTMNDISSKMVEVKPMHSESEDLLVYRSAKRNRKCQLHTIFDEIENSDNSITSLSKQSPQIYKYSSQSATRNRKSQITQFLDELDEYEPILDIKSNYKEDLKESLSHKPEKLELMEVAESLVDDINDNLNNFSIKRPNKPTEEEQPAKRIKLVSDAKKPKESLVAIFKKTKLMKIDKIKKEEGLIDSMITQNKNVKVTKFKVKIQAVNSKVYSGHKMMYENDPRWENRLNYSNFSKINNSSNYNPILDSTIKTVKFKSSNYKSNERQVNLYQNDDMIAELDTMFESRPRQSQLLVSQYLPSIKCRNDTVLFVDSDYEDTQEYNTDGTSAEAILKMPEVPANASQRGTSSKQGPSFAQFDVDGEDDDMPVFKSRRR